MGHYYNKPIIFSFKKLKNKIETGVFQLTTQRGATLTTGKVNYGQATQGLKNLISNTFLCLQCFY